MQIKTFLPVLFLTTATIATLSAASPAQDACGQTITRDLTAINTDLSVIASQAEMQGFEAAVEQFAADVEIILPTLSRPSQEAVEKFSSDLAAATSPGSPGGTEITPSERLKLISDWTIIVASTGITQDQLTTISGDLVSALSSLRGISTAQLQADINTLLADVSSCRTPE